MLTTPSGPGYLYSEDEELWLWHLLKNLYIWITISSGYGWIPLALWLIEMDGGSSTLSHICRFTCQQRLLKAFPNPAYLPSKDGVFWLWHLLESVYIWITISFYCSILLILGLIGTDGALSTACDSGKFACQHGVLETFTGTGSLCSEDRLVWLWHLLLNLFIWLPISCCYGSIRLELRSIGSDYALSN